MMAVIPMIRMVIIHCEDDGSDCNDEDGNSHCEDGGSG